MNCRKGKFQGTANILRKYLGDFLISSYLEVVHDSGYDDAYIQEIEVGVHFNIYIFFQNLFQYLIRFVPSYFNFDSRMQ